MPPSKSTPVLHVVASFNERDGGPARYISELCSNLAARGHAISLLTAIAPRETLMSVDSRVRVRVVPQNGSANGSGFAGAVTAWTRLHAGGIVHQHGLWRSTMHRAAVAARRARVPVVWAPMGMLEPWALGHRAWKKKLAWWMYQRRDLAGAAVLHATSRLEADGVRQAGLHAPVAVIPLGVTLPERARPDRPELPTRTALFLSRIHPKKGLLMLLEAWAALRPAGWRLVIAGNDENGHAAEVRAAIARLRLNDVVSMPGPAYGEAKEELFREAQIFILPSHSENFAVVIAEALVRELPVLTTTGTPWPELIEKKAGWWVEPEIASIQAALAAATALPREELRAM